MGFYIEYIYMEPTEPRAKTEVRFAPETHNIVCQFIEKFCINNLIYIGEFKALVYAFVKFKLLERFPDLIASNDMSLGKVNALQGYHYSLELQCIVGQVMVALKELEDSGKFKPELRLYSINVKDYDFPWCV